MQFKLDLSDKDSIKEFSEKVKENCERIDILINNAAVMALP
jgi:NADP-dependent 3-hydroxy acid dehydrogenase YdfG